MPYDLTCDGHGPQIAEAPDGPFLELRRRQGRGRGTPRRTHRSCQAMLMELQLASNYSEYTLLTQEREELAESMASR